MSKKYTVQSNQINYQLHTLGWKAFQNLCTTIISDILGHTVQSFLDTNDGGRDGAFYGELTEANSENYVVQCKHTTKTNKNLVPSFISDDLKKAKRLAQKGLCHHYLLMTNMGISGTTEEKIRSKFLSVEGINNFRIYGRTWITNKIKKSKQLRMLVPRIYGLGDLSQILDQRAYSQANEILSYMSDDLNKLVVTDAYKKSAKALINHDFVLLLGEPAAGKSTIAAGLALGAIDNWNCSTIRARNADEFVKHWNPHEPNQFFWIDDAFGATQHIEESSHNWNQVLPHINSAIKKGAKILFTSRDYIYNSAINNLKTSSFPLIEKSQVVINVQELSINEKKQILYNHLKLGNQKKKFLSKIKPYLEDVAENTNFLPETARRLGRRLFTKNLTITKNQIKEFVDKPLKFLIDVLTGLEKNNFATLCLIFMNGSLLKSPVELSTTDKKALEKLGAQPNKISQSLNILKGSLTKLIFKQNIPYWTFKHPTISDAIAEIVGENPEYLDIYLEGANIDKIIDEVTCGYKQIKGAKIVVPPPTLRSDDN